MLEWVVEKDEPYEGGGDRVVDTDSGRTDCFFIGAGPRMEPSPVRYIAGVVTCNV